MTDIIGCGKIVTRVWINQVNGQVYGSTCIIFKFIGNQYQLHFNVFHETINSNDKNCCKAVIDYDECVTCRSWSHTLVQTKYEIGQFLMHHDSYSNIHDFTIFIEIPWCICRDWVSINFSTHPLFSSVQLCLCNSLVKLELINIMLIIF